MASTNTFAGTPPLPRWKANRSIRRCHPYARKSASQAVLTKMQLTLHATRRTPHGASRLVQAMSAWSVKTLRGPSRQCRDARVYGHTTTTVHDNEHTHTHPLPRPHARSFIYQANPEQSKHLQTARMKILGVWIDLVNLRTETYRRGVRRLQYGTGSYATRTELL